MSVSHEPWSAVGYEHEPAFCMIQLRRTLRHPFPKAPTWRGKPPDGRHRIGLRRIALYWTWPAERPQRVPVAPVDPHQPPGWVYAGNQDGDTLYGDGCVEAWSMGDITGTRQYRSPNHVEGSHGWTGDLL